MTILKLVVPILLIGILWYWNKRVRERREIKEASKIITPHYEFETLTNKLRKEIGPVILDLDDSVKVYRIAMEDNTIAVILFSTPSSLWKFRVGRGEEKDLGAYSHIHYVEVSEPYRKRGYFYKLMDLVISDTHRISSGITIDTEDPELRGLLKRKFDFIDCGTFMKLDYEKWK